MADIHVLTGSGDSWSVVFHIPVPALNNAAGFPYRTALVNSGIGGATVLPEGTGPGQITVAEKASIQAGAVYEFSISYPFESGGSTPAQLLATVRALYQREKTRLLVELQGRLRYFGYTEAGS
jgi:hypothetical protein